MTIIEIVLWSSDFSSFFHRGNDCVKRIGSSNASRNGDRHPFCDAGKLIAAPGNQLVVECKERMRTFHRSGVSISGMALKAGINASQLRKWVRSRRQTHLPAVMDTAAPALPAFIPVVQNDSEIYRGRAVFLANRHIACEPLLYLLNRYSAEKFALTVGCRAVS